MKAHFQMLAGYNAFANDLTYAAAAALPDDLYRADRGAFFKSMHGTLNHVLVADRIWMRRFTGQGDAPARLDAILFEELAPLLQARQVEDRRICAFVDALTPAQLEILVVYQRVTAREKIGQSLSSALAHFFNHQTHHRGQAHAILTGLGVAAPSLDLLLFQRQAGLLRGLPDA